MKTMLENSAMKTRFAITHINRDGMRTLSCPNQGRNHRDHKEDADKLLEVCTLNTASDLLAQIYGKQAVGTFEVRPVKCYDHGDAVGIYV